MNGGIVAAIIQARMGSSRLPGKVLADLAGRPVLGWMVRAAGAIPGVDRVVVATSANPADDAVAEWCAGNGTICHRGDEADVLGRFRDAARSVDATLALRLTADCPLFDPQVGGAVLRLLKTSGADYANNIDPRSYPDGLDCEAMTVAALEIAAHEATEAFDREHVTPYLRRNAHRFRCETLVAPLPGLGHERWTLDTAEDLAFLRAVAAKLPADQPADHLNVLALLERDPAVAALKPRANGGTSARLRTPHRGTSRSARYLERAERHIPLASQTFSKSRIQFPPDAPYFLTRGQGGRVLDLDGNEYVDMVCGLLSVVLGYTDPDVDWAIRRQLQRGISFSLASELEAELAERLVRLIPCAEMVRFGKNGTDATSACIRLARAHTGRARIAALGYHGWQDWYIGATSRHKGVPEGVQGLTQILPYGQLDAVAAALARHPGEFAAVILEPTTVADPPPGYLAELKDLAHRHGALLIFDEIITGFRWSLGGAQKVYGVTPDLAAFGKSMGNGMPISAVTGRADIMRQMEEVFLSSTFGGEALSLAAAIATIDKLEREDGVARLWRTGQTLHDGAKAATLRHGVAEAIDLLGGAPWKILSFRDVGATPKEAVKTLFLREMLRHGVLIAASHNVCFAHDDADVAQVLAAWDAACAAVADGLARGDIMARLGNQVIRPIFSVR